MARATVAAITAVVAAVLLAGTVNAQNITDADILNFALNLECLEAQFYSYAAYGKGLSAADRGNGPEPTGGQRALLSGTALSYAEQIADDEIAHVRFLRAALGSAAVPCPALNLGTAFATAANAALNTTLTPPFNPYDSDVVFYHGAFIFEDVGVTAYKGAAALIANKDYLTAAAGILAVEAYHAGAIRSLLYTIADQYVFPYPATVGNIINAIALLRDTLDLDGTSDVGIVSATNGTIFDYTALTLVPADANAIAFSRTPAQVISIVTGGAPNNMGLFFPAGLNGNIK